MGIGLRNVVKMLFLLRDTVDMDLIRKLINYSSHLILLILIRQFTLLIQFHTLFLSWRALLNK